jgi:hypothetical protein
MILLLTFVKAAKINIKAKSNIRAEYLNLILNSLYIDTIKYATIRKS